MWSVSIFLKNVFGLYKRSTNYFEISIKTRKKEEETDDATFTYKSFLIT